MPASEFTLNRAQELAVRLTGRDLLVTAGAGTGKTTVLVERVLHQLREKLIPTLADILIVTFTEKAAQQMRDRLARELTRTPELRSRLSQLPRCQISTIHSFCGRLLRENFLDAGVEPTFRILDEHGAWEAREEALRKTFHDWYLRGAAGDGREFQSLVEMSGYDERGERLRALVHRIYDFARVTPDPEKYLTDLVSRTGEEAFGDLPWPRRFLELLTGDSQGKRFEGGLWGTGLRFLQAAISLASAAGRNTSAWEDALRTLDSITPRDLADPPAQAETVRRLQSAGISKDADRLRWSFPQAPRNAKTLPGFTTLLEEAKRILRHELIISMPWDPERIREEEKGNLHSLRVLVSLVRGMEENYDLYKRRNGLLDFSDLELFTARLLKHRGNELGLDRRFREVLVDEFQDVNALQNTILSHLSAPSGRFRVGDVKQSIYQFRLADPKIFLDEADKRDPVANEQEAERTDGSLLIYLAENHRSRPPILRFVNHVFSRLFRPEEIGSPYESQALEHGREDGSSPPVMLHVILRERARAAEGGSPSAPEADSSPKEAADPQWSAPQLEARFTAREIYNLIVVERPSVPVKNASPRAARWGDAAVLLRSKTQARVFLEALQEAGIPAYLAEGGSIFDEDAVRDFRALLSVIDNPRDDVALAACLRSPLCGVSDAELLRVRLAWPEAPAFLDALAGAAYRDDPESGAGVFLPLPASEADPLEWCGAPSADFDEILPADLRSRLRGILDRLRTWRSEYKQMELVRFLSHLSEEVRLPASLLARGRSSAERAALEKLLALAGEYEAERGPSLHGFLHRLSSLESGGNVEGVPEAAELEDAVAISTIHKAKGLEYPFVFLPQLSRKGPTDRSAGKIRIGRDWIGIRRLDYVHWGEMETTARLVLEELQREEERAEETRILYVALTRARERLILIGSAGKWKWDDGAPEREADGRLVSEAALHASRTYLDWIAATLPWERSLKLAGGENGVRDAESGDERRSSLAAWTFADPPVRVFVHRAEEAARSLLEWTRERRLSREGAALHAGLIPPPSPPSEEISGELRSLLRRIGTPNPTPPLAELDELKGKYWVTELKSLADRGRERALEEEGSGLLTPGLPAVAASPAQPPRAARRPPAPAEACPVGTASRPAIDPEEASRIGTIYHAALSRLDLTRTGSAELERQFTAMSRADWWEGIPRDAAIEAGIDGFFHTDLGRRLSEAARRDPRSVEREATFSRKWPISRLRTWLPALEKALDADARWTQGDWREALQEAWVLIQGRIDCLFREGAEWTVIDWKTDRVTGAGLSARASAYAPQMAIYRDAVAALWGKPKSCWLVFVSGGTVVEVA